MRRATFDLGAPGWAIAGAIGVLTTIGIASIYVTDTHYVLGNDGPANAFKQVLRFIAGLAVASIVLRVGYQAIGRYSYSIFLVGIGLLIPLVVAKVLHSSLGGLTPPRNGAYRWIQLPGLPLQPSEFMKIAFVVALAWYLRYRKNYRKFDGLLVPVIVACVPMGLILLEPDLGTAMLLVPVLFGLLFIAGARIRHLACLALAGIVIAPLLWGHLAPYQRLRVTALLLQNDELRKAVIERPDDYANLATKRQALEWAAGAGYQLVQSKNAIGSGGVLGHGWGQGIYVENNLLPDRHNDFIFAIVTHQWGLIGGAVIIACYAVITVAGLRIASSTSEPFARLLAVGVVALMICQALISMAMTMGLLPITGMTLPFVSYGGSSLLFNFASVALLVSVAQHRPYLLTTDPYVLRRDQHERLHGSDSGNQPNGSPFEVFAGS